MDRKSPHDVADLPPDLMRRTMIMSSKSAHEPLEQEPQPAPLEITEGEIPSVIRDNRLIMLNFPDSFSAASFRVLRHRLVQYGDPHTIMVTSAEPMDGKTTCAINLAMALAEGGRARVLIVEANTIAPSMAKMLRIRPPECFAAQLEMIRQGEFQSWKVLSIFSPWLHLLAVDPSSGLQPLTMGGMIFEIAMAQLKNIGYDFIVIDSPSVLGLADANLIQDTADGVVLTTWARNSRTSSLRKAIEQLTPAKISGIALLNI
jgi:Mrp family chromosome partitioning ATPase